VVFCGAHSVGPDLCDLMRHSAARPIQPIEMTVERRATGVALRLAVTASWNGPIECGFGGNLDVGSDANTLPIAASDGTDRSGH